MYTTIKLETSDTDTDTVYRGFPFKSNCPVTVAGTLYLLCGGLRCRDGLKA